jgi:hypothetical protein
MSPTSRFCEMERRSGMASQVVGMGWRIRGTNVAAKSSPEVWSVNPGSLHSLPDLVYWLSIRKRPLLGQCVSVDLYFEHLLFPDDLL